MNERTKTTIAANGDPERDAGWLVDTPWLGRRAAVFGLTKDAALQQAERSRAAHVAELQALVDRWSAYELNASFSAAPDQESKLTEIEKAMLWERMSGERLSDIERKKILDGGAFQPPHHRSLSND